MRDIKDIINENASITGLKPAFFFTNMQFFETMTDPEQQKFITSSYKRVDNNHYIYFFYKSKQLGYLKLRPCSI